MHGQSRTRRLTMARYMVKLSMTAGDGKMPGQARCGDWRRSARQGRYGECHCLAASRTVHLCHPFRVQKSANSVEIRPRQVPSGALILLASTPTPQHCGRVTLSRHNTADESRLPTPKHSGKMPGQAGHDSGRKPPGMTEDGKRKTEICGQNDRSEHYVVLRCNGRN